MKIRLLPLLLAACLALSLLLAPLPHPASAQTLILDENVDYSFGSQIKFKARLADGVTAKEVILSFKPQGAAQTIVLPANLSQDGSIELQYDLAGRPIRAFSKIEYWYTVNLENGQSVKTTENSFYYEDNRFNWQVLDKPPFRVHWNEGDQAFGQSVLDIAQAGLQKIQSILPLTPPQAINVYVYSNSNDMQATLRLSGQTWVAGHADPDLAVAVVTLQPGPEQTLLTKQRVPHELMHIMIYQAVGSGYYNLPNWLNEGLASISELSPDPEDYRILSKAYEAKTIIPISSLCQTFPMDASGAALAYAESAYFTRYLYTQYGTTGLENLVAAYSGGQACTRAPETSLKLTLAQLQTRWLEDTFSETAAGSGAWTDLLPWFILFAVVLVIPIALAISFKPRQLNPKGL